MVTTCTCDIWSCGMVKSCGVADFEVREEYEVISLAPRSELHPASAQATAAANPTAAKISSERPECLNCRVIMADSWFPRLREAVRAPADKPRATGGRRAAWRDSCARRRENPAGLPRRAGRRIR